MKEKSEKVKIISISTAANGGDDLEDVYGLGDDSLVYYWDYNFGGWWLHQKENIKNI